MEALEIDEKERERLKGDIENNPWLFSDTAEALSENLIISDERRAELIEIYGPKAGSLVVRFVGENPSRQEGLLFRMGVFAEPLYEGRITDEAHVKLIDKFRSANPNDREQARAQVFASEIHKYARSVIDSMTASSQAAS